MIEYISKADQTNPTTNTGTATTTTVVNLPPGAQDGDFLLAVVSKDTNAVHTLTPPAGWTLITSQETTSLGLYAYYKFASSEGSTYSWSISGSARSWSVGVHCYRGVSVVNPINTSSTSTGTTTQDLNFPAVTTTVDACQIVALRTMRKVTGPSGTGLNSSDGTGDIVKTASYGVFDAVGQTDTQRYTGAFRSWTSTGGVANGNTSLLATANSYIPIATYSATWSATATATISNSCLMTLALQPAPPVYVQYNTRGYMAVEHVGTQCRYNSGSTSGNATVTNPDGIALDDYLLATLVTNNDTITPPSGWTLLFTDAASSGAAWQTRYYGKVAVSADVSAANYSWNVANTTAAPSTIILSIFRGVDTLNPVNTSATTLGTTAGTVNAADVTPTVPSGVIHLVTQRRSVGVPPNYSCGTDGFCEMADVTNAGASVSYTAATYWFGQNMDVGLVSGPSLISSDATSQTDYARRTFALQARIIGAPVKPFNSSVHRSSRW